MPPKAPNLKFKPKLVLREDDATVRAPPPQSTEDLSLVQLARLQGLYVNEEKGTTPPAESEQQTQAQRPASAASGGHGGASSGRGGGGGGVSLSSGCGAGGRRGGNTAAGASSADDGAEDASGSALLRPKTGRGHHLSAHAALEEAARRHVDLSAYPETAPVLPVNSMNTIVSPAMARQGALLHTALYPPLPLDASLPSRLATEAETASASTVAATPIALAEDAPLNVDGTAFLREAERELQRAYEFNRRFYEEQLRPTQYPSSTTPASAAAASGELLWMQLPRFHENPPFCLADLPPGKVGELKVLKSGRIVLELAGVYYDVSVEGYDEVGSDGASAMAVATQPSPYPSDPSSKPSCYELGLLQKKLICTPTLE